MSEPVRRDVTGATSDSVRVFHRTSRAAAAAILENGFRDATGNYMTQGAHEGVWVTRDRPWSLATGGIASDETLLMVEIPDELFDRHEWVGPHPEAYREALIPAVELNAFEIRQAWECAECSRVAEADAPGWRVITWTSVFTGQPERCEVCPDCA